MENQIVRGVLGHEIREIVEAAQEVVVDMNGQEEIQEDQDIEDVNQ